MNTLTDEQLAEIADKGAEAASSWDAEAPARVAFARTVIDLALAQLAGGEGDLVTVPEAHGLIYNDGADYGTSVINTRHRTAMAALRAQMQGRYDNLKSGFDGMQKNYENECVRSSEYSREIASLKSKIGMLRDEAARTETELEKDGIRIRQLEADRDQWKERAEKVEANALSLSEKVIDLSRQLAEQKQPSGGYISSKAPADREAFERAWRDFLSVKQVASYPSFEGGYQAALAHKQPWIPCSERMPTREDGNSTGEVLWVAIGAGALVADWDYFKRNECTRWMRIPPAPEKEKEPEWVPLEACDVPPGSVFRPKQTATSIWFVPLGVMLSGVGIADGVLLGWELLKAQYEISRDNGKTWEACKKIKQP